MKIIRKYLKNRKGFTLVEMMMVVAVIGILASFLIPKIGATKDQARLAGVDSNFRQVQAQCEALATRNAGHADTFNTELTAAITAMSLTNPFGGTAVVVGTTAPAAPVKGEVAVVVPSSGTITTITINSYDNSATPVQWQTATVSP